MFAHSRKFNLVFPANKLINYSATTFSNLSVPLEVSNRTCCAPKLSKHISAPKLSYIVVSATLGHNLIFIFIYFF